MLWHKNNFTGSGHQSKLQRICVVELALLEATTYIKIYVQQRLGKSWCAPVKQRMRLTGTLYSGHEGRNHYWTLAKKDF